MLGADPNNRFLDSSSARESLGQVIELMGNEHGWSASRRVKEYHEADLFLITMGSSVGKTL